MIRTARPASSALALLLVALPLIAGAGGVNGAKTRPTALFAFGDSYADTGNHDKNDPSVNQPWKPPYGHTWPGKPAGRFTDGKLLTDYTASILNITLPVTYRELDLQSCDYPCGINFAFGGSGVFDTRGEKYPTVGQQISQLESILDNCSQTKLPINTSLVLLVVAGNDYSAYMKRNNGTEGILSFIPEVVDQIQASILALYRLGFRTFALPNLEPTGCLPQVTSANNYTHCEESVNTLATVHNTLLSGKIANLSKLSEVDIISMDQYNTFLDTFGDFANYIEPCCQAVSSSYNCGDVDTDGNPLYTVCSSPEAAFFWDGGHPTHAGWKAVSERYKSLLRFDECKSPRLPNPDDLRS